VDACLQLRCLATHFLYLRAFARRESHRKHSFPSIVAFIRVYKAVAWQRIDQIRYKMIILLFLTAEVASQKSVMLLFITVRASNLTLYMCNK
jgi:hypothetical protein